MLAFALALSLIAPVALVCQTQAPSPQSDQTVGGTQPEPRFDDLPWPVKLGVRAATVELSLPVAKQVTLVPDVATWLDEVSRWTREARWPVLIEEERRTPIFIRAFQPERVIRRSSIGAMPTDKAALERAMDAAITRAWNGDPEKQTSLDAIKAAQLMPPGVVITSATDPAWTAGVALAAGRGLPLRFVDGDFGAPDGVLDAAGVKALDTAIRAAIESTGLPYQKLGDAVDAVALCRTLAAKCLPDIPSGRRVQLPADAPGKVDDPLSTTDVLGREADGTRSTIIGWISGPSDRAAYMAMCSLFLAREDWWFISGYATTAPWSNYALDGAASTMRTAGFSAKTWIGDQASLSSWRKLLMGGFDPDVLVMNSSGDPDWFSLNGNDRGRTNDMPFLNRPMALHLIHSWSLNRPDDRATIGGRLLERGVYSYYGSVQEPFLFAFVPPASLAARWSAYGPFLVSSRVLNGTFDSPWRLTAIGDPLMTCIPPAKRIIPVAALPEPRGENVLDAATALLKAISAAGETPKPEDFTRAMRDLVLLGRDDVALGLWQLASSKGLGSACAAQALPAIFRKRMFTEFLAAYQVVARADKVPSTDATDMLWQLAGPRAMQLDADTLTYLLRHLRGPDVSGDLGQILPGVDKAMGRMASDRFVQDEMARTTDVNTKARLSELLRR